MPLNPIFIWNKRDVYYTLIIRRKHVHSSPETLPATFSLFQANRFKPIHNKHPRHANPAAVARKHEIPPARIDRIQ